MYWCYHCYARNPRSHGACVACGEPIEAPSDLSYDELLAWTLGHPDGDRALLAAQTLGERHSRSALSALIDAVAAERDPYVAAAALRSAVAIAGPAALHDWLQQVSRSGSFLVREAARQALSA